MSFFLFKITLWGSREGIISLILLTKKPRSENIWLVQGHTVIGSPRTSSMLTSGAGLFPHTKEKLRRGRKQMKRTNRNQNTSLYHYLVLVCRTGMTLPSLFSWIFSFPESLSRTSCVFSEQKEEAKMALSYNKTSFMEIFLN